MTTKKNRLGRGLETLMEASRGLDKILPLEENPGEGRGQPLLVAIDLIDLNPDQPRRLFNEEELASLAQSIKENGLIQPVVASVTEEGRYELIAGERRLKAAQLINLEQIPVIIKKISKKPERLLLALVENLCRADLNPIEEAESFARLEKDFGQTHQEIASMVGRRERSSITNSVRLLKLPDFIKDDIRYGRMTAGHGRALLGLADPKLFSGLRGEILAKKLSVRQTEAIVRKLNKKRIGPKTPSDEKVYYDALAQGFSRQLRGLKVKINFTGQVNKLEVFYSSQEELEWLMTRFGVEPV